MTHFAMLRRSGSITLLVHAVRVVMAMTAAWPLMYGLPRATGPLDPGEAALLLQSAARLAPGVLVSSATCLLLYVALTPLLAMWWLHAMRHEASPSRALQRALRDYPAALVLGMSATLALAIGLCPALLGLRWAPGLFPDSEHAQAASRIAASTAALAVWLLVATAHDRARAAIVLKTSTPLRALLARVRNLSASDLAWRTLVAAASAGVLALAELASRASDGALPPWAVAGIQQLLLLPATVAQGLWLAHTLTREQARIGAAPS